MDFVAIHKSQKQTGMNNLFLKSNAKLVGMVYYAQDYVLTAPDNYAILEPHLSSALTKNIMNIIYFLHLNSKYRSNIYIHVLCGNIKTVKYKGRKQKFTYDSQSRDNQSEHMDTV